MRHSLLTLFFFLILMTIILRGIFLTQGIIGHTWDWNIPNFPEQFRLQTEASFFVWDNRLFGGFFSYFKFELPYWLLNSVFSSFGGEVFSKLIPVFILTIAALSMFFTVRKIFSLNHFWAFMSALLYMLSPFSYSRLIAGHLPILLGYAFLPLIFYFSVSLFDLRFKKENSMVWLPRLIFLVLVLALGIPHPLVLVVSWGIIFLTAGVYLILRGGQRKNIAQRFFLVLFFWVLLNSYRLLPILSQVARGGRLSVKSWQLTTEELSFRLPYFSSVSRPLSELFSFSYQFGLNTEFVYPLPDLVRPIFVVLNGILFASSIVAFYLAIKNRKEYFPPIFILTITEFVGFTLVAGEKTIIGRLFFLTLIRFVPLVFSVFSNPLRFLPLVVLPFSILSFITLAMLEEKYHHFAKIALRGLIVFTLLVFFYPWFFHNLTTPVFEDSSQPMSLKVTKVNPEDKKVFDFLKEFKEDFRVTYLPPAFVSWPGETDLSYSWNTIYSPKSVFLERDQPPLSEEIIKSLYSQKASSDLSKLLGLGSVETIIYPQYQQFESYRGFIPETVNYKPIVDRNWSEQKNIIKLPSSFETVDLYENENFIPHIFIPEQTSYIGSNNREALLDLASLSNYKIRNGIFFSPDNQKEKISLVDKLGVTYAKPECVGCEPLSVDFNELFPSPRFLPSSPFYFLADIKEKQLLKAVSKNPHLRANEDLLLATKKLAETKIMIEEEEDISLSAPKAIDKYYSLLMDFEQQLDYLTKEDLTNNQLLARAQVFLSHQQEDLIMIIQKTRNGEISRSAKQALEDLVRVLSRINSEVWLTTNNQEIKYLFSLPEDSQYHLLKEQMLEDLSRPLNFEIDGESFSEEGEEFDDNWLKLKTVSLNQGIHKLKINLPPPDNLFSGFATSSAVKRDSDESSFTLMAQEETTTVSSPINNLDDRAQYRISFKYRVLGYPIRFIVEQENDPVYKGVKKHKIDVLLLDYPGWQEFDQLLSPNFGSHEAELKFYLNADRNRADIYIIEDIKIEQMIIPNLLFKKVTEGKSSQIPKITFAKINRTKYKVKVEDATDPYFLVFSETYNDNWKAYISHQPSAINHQLDNNIIASYFDGQIKEGEHKNIFLDREIFANIFKEPVPEENHLLVNAFGNAWYINQSGDYEITLEFIPQRIYFLGLWISFICLILILGYLGVLLIKQRG